MRRKTRPTSPGSGERRAIGGYQPQYRFAAEAILRGLRAGCLEWVRLADPEAGRVDDLQLGSPGRVDAFSVKWSKYPSSITLHRLTSPDGKAPSLIAQLAKGWSTLEKIHQGSTVVVHLVTPDRSSSSIDLPDTEGSEAPRHFAAFLAECWPPGTEFIDSRGCPQKWQGAWKALREATGFGESEFKRFLRHCRLEFGYQFRAVDEEQSGSPAFWQSREAAAWREDVNALAGALFRIVADPSNRVEIGRDELLAELGWRDRVEFRSPHEFPDPSIPYREISHTAQDLKTAIDTHSGGYLILLGSPGSGKSTLLTRWFRYRPDRVVRYYAYVPDSYGAAQRGESVHFLHDVVLSLDQLGFRAGDALQRPDIDLLASRLRRQLAQLGEDHRASGRTTFLVIDGLDHIPREQTTTRSLLADLPGPDDLPEGVFVVLGSQTDQLPGLRSEVANQILEPDRRVEMRRLSREAVSAVVTNAHLSPTPGSEETSRIYELSEGHPLALEYIVHRLRGSSGRRCLDVLSEIEPFRERVDDQYLAHWRQVSGDRPLVRLLAKLARTRGPFAIDWVETWADPDSLYKLHEWFRHYFKRELDGRWHFFHNSFRVFLLEQTASLPGVSSSKGDADLYRELAQHCREALVDNPVRWDELHYLAEAGDHHAVLRAADSRELRLHLFAGRSPSRIIADLRRALPSAQATSDPLDFARLVLSAAEFSQRAYHLDDVPLADLLLGLGWNRAAVDHVRKGRSLLIDPRAALEACGAFESAGMRGEAELLFSLAEPLNLLSGSAMEDHEAPGALDLLFSWVDVAPRFRSLDSIMAAIETVSRGSDPIHGRSAEQTTTILRARLKSRLVAALCAEHRWNDARGIVAQWDPERSEDWSRWFWTHVNAWRQATASGDTAEADRWFAAAWPAASDRELKDREKVAVAEGLFRLRAQPEAAAALLEGLPQPALANDQYSPTEGFEPFGHRFRLNRLLGALGDTRPPSEVVPDSDPGGAQTVVVFERLVVVVARLWGRAWLGDFVSSGTLVSEAQALLRFTSRPFDPNESFRISNGARLVLHRLLVNVAGLHGTESLSAVRAAYETEWSDPELGPRWPPDLVREIALEFVRKGQSCHWGRKVLEGLSPEPIERGEVWGWLDGATKQFRGYLDLGDRLAAGKVLRAILEASFSLAQRDNQFSSWVKWAEAANRADPAGALGRLTHLGSCMPGIAGTDGSLAVTEALVRAAVRFDPGVGLELLDWMLARGLLRFDQGVGSVLGELLARPDPDVDVIDSVYRHLALPFATSPSSKLVESLAGVEAQQPHARGLLLRLVEAIQTAAIPKSREGLLAAVEPSVSLAVPEWQSIGPIPSPELPDDSASRLQYFSGGPQSENEVRTLLTSVEAVLEVSKRELPDSFFRWDRVLDDVVRKASAEEIFHLAEHFVGHRHTSGIHSLLAVRLSELGEADAAWTLGLRALNATRPYGWREHYGDDRVFALQSLCVIDESRAQELAFATVVQDLVTSQVSFNDIAFELHRIAPLLGPEKPVEIWEEVREYTSHLVRRSVRGAPPPLEVDSSQSLDPLLLFAAKYLAHPAYSLDHAAQRLFVDLLLSGHTGAAETIAAQLQRAEPRMQASALLVALSVAQVAPGEVTEIARGARPLLSSPWQNVRHWTRALLSAANVPAAGVPAGTSIPLPGVYHLEFERRGEVHRLRDANSTELLPETEDVVEIVLAFRDTLDLVAKAARVQPEALYHRVAQLAPIAGSSEGTRIERELREALSEVGLSVGFRRPQSLAVRGAMFQALAELVDAGRIPGPVLKPVEHRLREADPGALRLRPSARPTAVKRIPERSRDRYVESSWTQAVSYDTIVTGRNADGVILGEDSKHIWLSWKRPTEFRRAVVVGALASDQDVSAAEDPLRELCALGRVLQMNDYASWEGGSDRLLTLQHPFQFDTPANRWLALNPSIARKVGWTLAAEGTFRWLDSTGDVMAESIWWQDGFTEHQPPHPTVEVASGWLVRATLKGWSVLRQLSGAWVVCSYVDRRAEEQPDARSWHVRGLEQ